MAFKMARRTEKMKASAIRELLKLTERPEVISFAGGLPAREMFPTKAMAEVAVKVMEQNGADAMQYGTTEGFTRLREQIAERMNREDANVTKDEIMITNGSQQGLDFVGKIFLDPGDFVICESPSYLGAINAFQAYECNFLEVKTDESGMLITDLEEKLASTDKAKFIYVIPDFQNPTGKTWSLERRQQLLETARKHNLPVVEDAPYRDLRFEGDRMPTLFSLDKERVVYLGTFSKTFSPGIRIGWITACPQLMNKFLQIKQAADLQASSISQRELSMYLDSYNLDSHIQNIIAVYHKRRDVMLKAMEEEFPEGCEWTHPEGGLFAWVTVPEGIDTVALAAEVLKNNVAYVPGISFFPNGGVHNTMRLNYSCMPEEKIKEGIKRMGEVLRNVIG